MIGVRGRSYLAHRLAVLYQTGRFPPGVVDHINRDPFDNRWTNLREATPSENSANSGMYATNTSGYRGAAWDKHRSRWRARVRYRGKLIHLGFFSTAWEAGEEVRRWRAAKYGEFALEAGQQPPKASRS
jgi:hypothetical protein